MSTTDERLPNIHPGEILRAEFLEPMEITQYRVAKDTGVPPTRIAEICAGRRSISADTALRLAKYFETSPKFWLGLQEDFDLENARLAKADELDAIVPRAG